MKCITSLCNWESESMTLLVNLMIANATILSQTWGIYNHGPGFFIHLQMMLRLYINVCIVVRLLTIYQVTQDPLKSKWYDMTDITRKNVTPLEYGENKQLYTSNSLMLPIPIYQIQIKVHFLFPRRKKTCVWLCRNGPTISWYYQIF